MVEAWDVIPGAKLCTHCVILNWLLKKVVRTLLTVQKMQETR